MADSMTGFGKGMKEGVPGRITIEIKSVNHRYLDISTHVPRELSFLDIHLRDKIKSRICRGKIDVSVLFEPDTDETVALHYNPHIAKAYFDGAREMAETLGIEDDMTTSKLSALPFVFEKHPSESNEEALTLVFDGAMDNALDTFIAARHTEGERLREDLEKKTLELSHLVAKVEERCPEILEAYKEKLKNRLAEFADETAGIDSSRLAQEVTLFSDKIAVDEEIVRLKSHIQEMIDTLRRDGEIGRRLDFLSQELNREANTILSKSSDTVTDAAGVEMKTLIEKIREQIQNLE